MLTFELSRCIISLAVEKAQQQIAVLCNGSTADSDSVC